jgi:hypothetical protein
MIAMSRRAILFLCVLALAGCECGTDCGGVVCGPCPNAISIDIVVPGGGTPGVSGTPALSCETVGSMTHCFGDAGPGEYTYEISAPGRAPRSVTLALEPGGTGCCACAVEADSEYVSFEILDAGTDASTMDASATDAGEDASSSVDAGSCRPERVDFPSGGGLEPGTMCDDVFVCAPDADYAARVVAASGSFTCTGVDGAPCDGVLCRFVGNDGGGPSTLDALEIEEICAVTLIDPEPLEFVCRVYL